MDERPNAPQDVTVLLHAWRAGQAGAYDRLIEIVYPKLCSLAARCMGSQPSGHTLNATGLVHEAYLKILGAHPVGGPGPLLRRLGARHAADSG